MNGLRYAALFLVFTCVSIVGRTQVFIPSQVERDLLNELIPGIVDAGGIMDTLHPGIGEVDSANIVIPSSDPGQELVGIKYLNALEVLRAVIHADVTLSSFPTQMRSLRLDIFQGITTLGGLPNGLDQLYAFNALVSGTLNITSFPDTIDRVDLLFFDPTEVDRPGYIGLLHIDTSPYLEMCVAQEALHIDELTLFGTTIAGLDLSAWHAREVNFHNNAIENFTGWPSGATIINTSGTSFYPSIPPWPSTLETLVLDASGFSCLPPFPDGLANLSMNFTPRCLPNWPSALNLIPLLPGDAPLTEQTATYCSVLNSECPGSYPGIAGRVFVDGDGDGLYDAGEPAVPHSMVTLLPNGNSVGPDADGSWEIGVPPGNYTITAGTGYPYIQSMTPAQHTADVQVMGSTDLGNDFAVTLIPDIQDLRAHVHADVPRPGFDNQVYVRCENYGTTTVDAAVSFTFDADQTWVGSSITPASLIGNTATWNFPGMAVGAVQHILVDLNTAASVALEIPIAHTLTLDPIATDETPANNTYTFTDIVVGSYDPNDKLLTPNVLSPAQVAAGETPIEYTIRFQNTGTYLAERVVILDTLSEDLQWESMRFIASSHTNHWYITDGVLHVIHNDIMLPDSTSDEPGSHGFIKFSMLPKSDLVDGETISNIAHIVFDFNEPIITPPAVFSVDIEAGIETLEADHALQLVPNPASDRVQLRMDGTSVMRYHISDALGRSVLSGNTTPHGWIDVHGLSAGPYVIDVFRNDVRYSQRFVKQ